jgi:UDP-2,3-diacylglucosamine hydrolase
VDRRRRHDAVPASICQALRQLSDSGTAVFLMHGNRDFLLGQAFCKQAGCTLLKDPSVVQLEASRCC